MLSSAAPSWLAELLQVDEPIEEFFDGRNAREILLLELIPLETGGAIDGYVALARFSCIYIPWC